MGLMGHVLDVFAGFTQLAAARRVFSAGGSGAPTSRAYKMSTAVAFVGVSMPFGDARGNRRDTAARVRRCKDIHEEGPLAGWQQLNLSRSTT